MRKILIAAALASACGSDAVDVPDDFQLDTAGTVDAPPGSACLLNARSLGTRASNGETRGHVYGGPSAYRMQFADLPEPPGCTIDDRILTCVWSGPAPSGFSTHTWTIDIDDAAATAVVTIVVDHEADANDCMVTFDASLTPTPAAN